MLLNDSYDQWHESVHGQEARSLTILQDWHRNALSLLPTLDGKKILEVGCGVGDFAIYLAQQGADVVAVGFSSKAIEIAKQKVEAQAETIEFGFASCLSCFASAASPYICCEQIQELFLVKPPATACPSHGI